MGRFRKEKSGGQKLKKAEVEVCKPKLKKELKKKEVRVRDRSGNISEQKLACPICHTDNKTYRVLVRHFRSSHPGWQLHISCSFMECGWSCAFSILCYLHHLKFDHMITEDWTFPLILVQGAGDFSSHSGICVAVMDERNIPNQEGIKLRMELEYCRKEAKRVISRSYEIGRSRFFDVRGEFPKEDHINLLEMLNQEEYSNLTKKFPMPDHMIFDIDHLLDSSLKRWNQLVAENIANCIFKERAEARIGEV